MRLIRPALLVAAVSLAFAPAAQADHVSAAPTASAHLGEELSDNAWEVIVDWAVNCSGASDPNYFGTLNLVDADTGERMYQGGISGASGTDRYPVERRATVRTVYPEIQASCSDAGASGHGSPSMTAVGAGVTVPARGGTTGGGGGGGGSGGDNPDAKPGGPAAPVGPGGCAVERRGTAAAETLVGTSAADLIYGLGGADLVRGLGGHDCLIGGDGADRLFGGAGRDRLTGGAGKDRLVGGSGRDVFDAGSGNDVVDARDGVRETVRCGAGRDRARLDKRDVARGCESVSRR